MEEILISVVVPVYNVEKYFRKCIDSIINQTYRKLQIILVDDGSSDSSSIICDEYAKLDERITVIHKENEGQALARNAGIEAATGEYITFVDADDYIDHDMYEKIVRNLNGMKPDIVAFNMIEEYSDITVKKENKYQEDLFEKQRLKEELFPTMLSYGAFFDYGILPNLVCKFIKRTFAQAADIRVNDKVRFGEDADATFQYLAKANSVQLINYTPYHYCKRNDSMVHAAIKPESICLLKQDLADAFCASGIWDIMEKQLEDYITFVTLLKNPGAILDSMNIFSDSKVALYGAGGFGQAVLNQYPNAISIVADSNYERYRDSAFEVISVDELITRQSEYDKVFIAILNVKICKTIKDRLLAMGMQKEVTYYGFYE